MKLAALALALAVLPLAAAHSSLITPKPRNAIDSELPEWKDGDSPYYWIKGIGKDGAPCACRNGTGFCASAQTCLWFSVGCSLGCKECDGGTKGAANPNKVDRCGSGFKATNNDPRSRTINRAAEAGSEEDWTKFNPWRAPGHAPIYDPWCAFLSAPRLKHSLPPLTSPPRLLHLRSGRASGGPHATGGKGEFTNTTYAKLGDLGSKVLPKYDTGTVWEAGSTVETMTSYRAIHGGGYQFRLCPLESNLTEACFHQTPMPFVGNSKLMISDGSIIELDSVDVSNGTLPVGGTWRMLAIPDKRGAASRIAKPYQTWAFEPPCHEPGYPSHPDSSNQGNCSGDWTHNITMYDYLRVPEHLEPGDYVLGFVSSLTFT
eukprot:SAG31_NODE_4926_length_2859_cov_110.767029_1_plen_374_part_00